MINMITTTDNFEGYRITGYYGVISEGTPLVGKIRGNLSDAYEEQRQKLYGELFKRLPEGASAIVGLKVQHIHMGGFDWFFATGTAVSVEQI